MFGGTLLVISGPCFRQTDSISLVMSDVKSKVNCEWLSEYSVTCISPPFYRTGRVMVQFRVILHDNQTFTFSSFVTIGIMFSIFLTLSKSSGDKASSYTPLMVTFR
jgi:hypothetical protein